MAAPAEGSRSLNDDQVAQLARQLDEAEAARSPLRHFSLVHPTMTLADAYAVQSAWVALDVESGRSIRGCKVGLTSLAMRRAAGIDEPDYGVLFEDMFGLDGHEFAHAAFIAPRIEMELAFALATPLAGPGCTVAEVLRATDFVIPAFEIIDTRFHRFDPDTNRPRTIVDTIADNAANAAVVLGGRPVRPTDIDLRWVGGLLYRNNTIAETGVSAAVLNHPANAVAWLVNKLATHEQSLNAGEIVLSGSFTASIALDPGDAIFGDFGVLGTLACRFT